MTPAYADIHRELCSALGTERPPIAITFLEVAPTALPTFKGAVPAGCSFWEVAWQGPIVTSTRDHELCAIGVYTHNLQGASPSQASELGDVLNVLNELQYVTPADVALIPVLKRNPTHVAYSPLNQVDEEPDVVLVFAAANQSLIITEAVQQVENGIPPALGRPACAVVPQVVNSGRAAMSLGCCGARAYLGVLQDDIALWAFPGNRLGEYAARIVALAKANQVISRFHQLRRQDVQDGLSPSVQQSLARLQDSPA